MLYSEIIALCSQIHTNTVWAERRMYNVPRSKHTPSQL